MGKQLGVGRVGITFLVSVFMAAVLIGGFIFVGTASAAGPWYVDGSVGASGDGLSEAEAFKTIAEAVTAATAGDTINILAGTYEEAVQLSSGLQGGLSIIGAGVDNTIIVGGIRTRANNSISISNLTVDGGYDWGDDGNGDPAIWVENGTSGHAFSNIKLVGPGYGPGVSKRGLEFSPSVSSVSISFLETYGWNSGIFLTGSNHVLSGLNVHDNNAGVGSSGISNVSIISSIFADNNEGFGADTVGVGVSVTGSSFVNNGTGVGHYGGNPISALGNFWGDATGPKNSVVNPDASGSLVTSNVTFSPWLDAAGGSEKSHNVEIVGGGTFNSISGALASASAGNVINILAGVYTPSSTIVLDKSVTLQGAQAGIDPRPNFGSLRVASSSAETILDGRGTLANILRISADAVVIDGFEIRHGTGDLVDSLDSGLVKQNPIIRNNIIHNSSADEGIQIRRTNNAIVEKNHVFATAGDGINSCCNTTSATIRFNEVHNISSPDAAIYAYDTVDTNIEGNLVYDVLSNDGIKLGDKNGSDANKSGGSIVNNIIHDTEQDGISVYQSGVLVQGNEVYNSSSENGAIHVAFAVSDIQILDNYVHDNILKTSKFINSAGILIRDTVNVASVSFSNNRLENNAPFSLANHKAGELVAKNNWWGVGNPKFADILSGSISFSPWLDAPNGNPRDFNVLIDANNNGTRDDGESTFDSIQDAIDAAVAGDKILVGSGVYTDSVTDGKGVIIQSVSGAANTEIVGRVTLNSNGAKINGFSINNPADNFGILINGINNVEVINNVVSHIGTSAPSANVWAIWYQDGAIDSDNIKIQNNAVSSVGNTGNNASNGAIGIGDSTGNSNITGVVISGNNISTVSSAKGAYGILLGHARHNSPSNMGSVTGAQVLNNTISGLTGGWAHGIGLEGDTPSAVVTGNHLSNFTTTPTPTNSAAVKVEDNPSGGTVSLSNNRFETGAIRWGVNNVASGVLVNATNNWWGFTASAQILSKMFGSVSFDPWYINPARTILSNAVVGDTLDVTGGDLDLTASVSGQADLPSGVADVTLDNNSSLDLTSGVSSSSGGNITVQGASISLDNYTKGTLTGQNLSVPKNVGSASVTIQKAVSLKSGVSNQPVVLKNNSLPNVSVSIPDNTTVLAPDTWDGKITPPKTGTKSGTAPSGFSVGSQVIEVGSPTAVLLFDQPVSVVLEGVTGAVGYRPSGSDDWVQITSECAGTYANPVAPEFPGECYISNGTDTKIYTFHFTTFGSLDEDSEESGGGSGGVVGLQFLGNPTPTPEPVESPEVTPTPEAEVRPEPTPIVGQGGQIGPIDEETDGQPAEEEQKEEGGKSLLQATVSGVADVNGVIHNERLMKALIGGIILLVIGYVVFRLIRNKAKSEDSAEKNS